MPAKRPDTNTKYDAFSTGSDLNKQNQDVRVGYIDPVKGYIDGLTVYQANKYAEVNPGTQFIHKNRDRVAYININTVNKLTNQNIRPRKGPYELKDSEGNYTGCNTVKGLITSPDGTELSNKPGEGDLAFVPEPSSGTISDEEEVKENPIVIIEGGGGVGAVAKAIVGDDGSIIHYRLVHGGFGYRVPPRVKIFDPNQRGAGATAKSFIGRQVVTSNQPIEFDQESDFENYDFNLPPLGFDPLVVPFGQSYSLSSNTVIGDWDPRKVLSVTERTGFEQELRKYLDFLKGFDPNKPWWTTRIEEPAKVVGGGIEKVSKKAINILFPVEHPAWGGEKNISKDMVSVEFEVYGQGSRGNRSIFYDFVAQDGSHKFRVKGVTHEARNEKTRVDVIKVKANTTYDVTASVIKDRGAKSELVEQGLLRKAGKNAKENRQFQEEKRSRTIFGDIIGSLNDNDDVQITAKRGRFKASNRKIVEVQASESQKEKFKGQPNRFKRATFDLTYRVNVPGATNVTRTILPSFMNNHAICPTLPSHKEGSDMHGNLYTMIWNEQFPYDGQYTFRGICDDKANVYIDGEKVMVLPGHKGTNQNFAPKIHKMFIEEGLHQIKIDLINKTFKKTIKREITAKGNRSNGRIPVDFEVYGQGSNKNTALKVIFTALNGSDTFTIRPKKEFVRGNYNYTKTVKILPNVNYKVETVSTAGGFEVKEKDVISSKKEYNIEYEYADAKQFGLKVSNNNRSIEYDDNAGNGFDRNAKLKIISESPGLKASFSPDGNKLIVKGKVDGNISINYDWDDNPSTSGSVLKSIKIGDTTWNQTGKEGSVTKEVNIGNLTNKRTKKTEVDLIPEQGTLKSKNFGRGGKGIEKGGNISNVMFADIVGSANDNDDIQIRCGDGTFIPSNKRKVKGTSGQGTQTRGTWDLVYRLDIDSPNDPRFDSINRQLRKNGFSTDIDLEEVSVFNTNDYIDKANRKLYKVYPCADETKSFFTQNAVTPFNPLELDKNFPKITKPKPEKPRKPKANFEQDGKNLKLKVTGSGKVKIGFQLKVDDNLRTSGVFAREVRINADGSSVNLKRDIKENNGRLVGREEETIKGEGVFTAGKEYEIKIIGGSSTSGFKTVDRTKVFFDDNARNGFDENGALKIKYVNAIEEKIDLGPLPNGTANKIPSLVYKGDTNDYAGTHIIKWNNVRFPVTGNYKIGVMVDDNVRIEIGTKKSGNLVNIYKKGFVGNSSRSTGKSEYIENIPEGNYTITAYLQQIPGRPINDGNPMGLAINIDTVFAEVEEEIIVNKTWYQNPYGAALTIHAPLPPIPTDSTENITQEDAQCPKNPIWTTRFNQASGEERWIPVNHRFADGRRSWSRFMNSYALSPILPLGTPFSGRSGETWETKWDLDIPYDGFYNFKGAVDNFATVSIGTHFIEKLNGFATEKKDLTDHKVFLKKGRVTLGLTVTNGEKKRSVLVERKCFNSADWATKAKDAPNRIDVNFDVYGQGSKRNMGLKFVFKEKGGNDTFIIDNVATSTAVETIRKRVKRNTDYNVTAIATGTFSKTIKTPNKENEFNIEYFELNPSNDPIRVVDNGKKIELKDGVGSGANVNFEILTPSSGVTAKFSDNGRKLIVKGEGDVPIKIKYDDNPGYAGEAVRSISIAGVTWTKERKEYGEETKTLRVGNSNLSSAAGASSTKNILFRFSHDDARDGNRIRIPALNIDSAKPSGSKGPFDPETATAIVEVGKVYEVEFVTENKAFLRLRNDGKKIECNDNSDNDHKDAIITTSDGTFFDLVNGGENGQPQNIGKAKFRFGDAPIQVPNAPAQVITSTKEINLVPEQGTSKVFGRGKKGTESNIPGQIIFADIIGSANDNDDMQIRCSRGIFTPSNKRKNIKGTSGQGTQKRNTWDLTFRVDADEETVAEPITSIGEGFGKYTTLNKELSRSVTTGGPTPNSAPVILNPTLATYRNGSLGPFLSPFFPSGTREGGSNLQGRTWDMVWENVDFPIAGDYKMEIEADDTLEVFIGENLSDSFGGEGYKSVGKTRVTKGVEVFAFNVPNPGKRDIKLILQNINIPGTTFQQNPTVAACKITCEIPVEVADTRSWLINPVGISAVLLAPPCQRKIEGRGKVEQVTIVEPGNTYPPTGSGGPGVPSEVTITKITTDKPGIGYTPGDLVCVEKENGTKQCFSPTLGEFGKIVGVGITPIGITRYPKITTTTSTGVGFIPNIITELRVDTPEVDPDTVIQVTDLAGLKQNGYIEGRPYYGEVFFKDGIPFAGRYETAGRLIQVYATLQESIDAEVTTRPSAIQRSGTDINSNNPRLNIPGTPDNLV